MTEDELHHLAAEAREPVHVLSLATVTRHPPIAAYDRVFAATLPDVPALAKHKNVPLQPGEDACILRHALGNTSRKSLRRISRGDDEATFSLYLAVSHSLDVFASARIIAALIAVEGRKVPSVAILVKKAERAMAKRFANDKDQTICIWPDVVDAATNHYNHISTQAQKPPPLTLPDSVTIRCRIRAAHKPMKMAVHPQMPFSDGAVHE